MKFVSKLLIFLIIFCLGTSSVLGAAGINRKINFQGKVVNKGATDGTNVTDGSYNFQFSFWTTAAAGTSIWSEVWNGGSSQVGVSGGIFSVALGTYTTFPSTVDFNSDSLYLSINYNGDGDMTPRLQMAAVPYAFNAEKVGGLTVTNTNGVLTVANGVGISMNQSVDSGSTVTFAGINIGGTVAFTNIPIAVGTTVLFIDSTGKLSKGFINTVGTTYSVTNGLNMTANTIGLGGTLSANTQIGTSGFSLSFLGLGGSLGFSQTSNGNVGIGTSNPLVYKLNVGGTELVSDLHISGRLGIGTTAPGLYVLNVGSSANFVNLFTSGSVGIGGTLNLGSTPIAVGSTVLYIDVNGNVTKGVIGAGSTYVFTNGISTVTGGVGLGGTLSQNTLLGTSSFGLSFLGMGNSQSFFIGTSGYVGIGTTNPQTKMEINSGINDTAGLRFTRMTSATTSGATNNKVLTVDSSGNVYIADDQTGSGSLPSGTSAGQMLRFNGSSWVVSSFLNNSDTSFGVGTTSALATVNIESQGIEALLSAGDLNRVKFQVLNSGGVWVNGATGDIVKTSTGTGTSGDFEGLGATMSYITSTNNQLSILDIGMTGGVQGVFTVSSLGTSKAVGAGGQVIVREDGGYIIVGGGTSATGSIWSGVGNTMTQVTIATGATLPGVGAIALKRPDRKYLLVHGNNSGYSSVFDPFNTTAAVAGPPMFGGVTVPAGAGTNAFQRNDGRYVVIGGGTTAWGMYDPSIGTTGVYVGGTGVAFNFGAGAHSLMRDDGNFIVFQGVGGSNYWLYTNTNFSPNAGQMALNPGILAPQLSAGAFSIKMNNGMFLVIDGGSSSSWVYDQNASQYGTFTQNPVQLGYGPSEGLADGAQSLWRPDGKYTIIVGTGSSSTYILDPSVDVGETMFSVGPTLPAQVGAGVASFMGGDGKYYIVRGSGTSAVFNYDMGYVGGGNGVGTTKTITYESEPINTNFHMNATSSLQWNANSEGTLQFFARTGVDVTSTLSAAYKPILRSGDIIGVGSSYDQIVQVKVIFKRDLPVFMDQEWGVRKANQTRYRRVNREPAIYDYTIDNSAALHRTQFDFGNSTDDSGPVQVNLINDRNSNLGLSLALFANAGGLSASNNAINLGSFGTHRPLTVGTSQAVVVMKKPDGTYEMAIGQTSAFSLTYDPTSQSFSSVGSTMTAKIGAGALAFKRPDGKYLMVLGDRTSTTNIYDPILDTYTVGPALTGNAGRGAQVILMPNGRVLIIHGNYTATSSIYDPFSNLMTPGVNFSSYVGNGALNIPRPDGTYMVVLGSTENCSTMPTTTNVFNPYTMTVGGTSPSITAAVAGRGIGPGSMAIPRADGNWLVVLGAGSSSATGPASVCTAVSNTTLYNPTTNRTVAGPALTGNAGYGAVAAPRADGSWLIMHGAALTTTSIYNEKIGAATSEIGIGGSSAVGPTALFAIGGVGTTAGGSLGGTIVFQRDDGKMVLVAGAGVTGVQQIDTLWVDKGIYKSEQMFVLDLDTNSALTWKASPNYMGLSAEVKTAPLKNNLQTAVSREISQPGGLINPTGGDQWISVTFNFKRQFPSYGGIGADVWYNSGSQSLMSNRTITTPSLMEYSVTKDSDLVNIQADGKSLFRVSSNGNVYTSNNGVVNSGGADLAENYSTTQDLQKGEVVAIDPTNNHAVKRSQFQYEPDLMGVVSSDPGFVAGSYTPDSKPIALIGRVPVLVSTENGIVRTGDRLTSSSTPGYAMRATKAGRVIGKALESMDVSKLESCPPSNFGDKGQKCTKIMTFVNLTDYLGMPASQVMADAGTDWGIGNTGSVYPEWMDNSNEKILQFLASSRNQSDSQNLSEVFTDKVVAKDVVADTIYANKIKANSIEGMEIYTNKIDSLTQKYEDLKNQVGKTPTETAAITISPAASPTLVNQFNSSVISKAMAEFWNSVLFKGSATFEKTPTFNKEMAGFAVINSGDDRVEIKFDNQYPQVPVVSATMVVETDDEKEILDQNYIYFVKKITSDGFVIVLNKKATTDIKFSWSALDIKDAKTFRQEVISVTPTSVVVPTSFMIATPSAEASSSATIGL